MEYINKEKDLRLYFSGKLNTDNAGAVEEGVLVVRSDYEYTGQVEGYYKVQDIIIDAEKNIEDVMIKTRRK